MKSSQKFRVRVNPQIGKSMGERNALDKKTPQTQPSITLTVLLSFKTLISIWSKISLLLY